jgi:hypothetical protein
MFVHIVWFEWKDDAKSEEIAAVSAALLNMRGKIPGMIDLWFGPNVTQVSYVFSVRGVFGRTHKILLFYITIVQRTPHSHGLVVFLQNASDLPIYNAHEHHQYALSLISPLKKTVNALDFGSEPPSPSPSYSLVLGTKNYSSWSMRVGVGLRGPTWSTFTTALPHLAFPAVACYAAYGGGRRVW